MEPGQNQGNTPDRILKHSVKNTGGARLTGTTTLQGNGHGSQYLLLKKGIAQLLQLQNLDDIPLWIDSDGWIVAYAPPGGGTVDTDDLPNEITVEATND